MTQYVNEEPYSLDLPEHAEHVVGAIEFMLMDEKMPKRFAICSEDSRHKALVATYVGTLNDPEVSVTWLAESTFDWQNMFSYDVVIAPSRFIDQILSN
jgi:alpha-D-ribose 1-methylphosphonate 5-triphosphate synthase subunit PhnH